MKILGKQEKREVTVKTFRPVLKHVCDDCGKELKNLYAYVVTYHNRWGNDSCDSFEYYEFCFDCAETFFAEYAANAQITDHLSYEVKNIKAEDLQIEVNDDGTLSEDDIKGKFKIIEN